MHVNNGGGFTVIETNELRDGIDETNYKKSSHDGGLVQNISELVCLVKF